MEKAYFFFISIQPPRPLTWYSCLHSRECVLSNSQPEWVCRRDWLPVLRQYNNQWTPITSHTSEGFVNGSFRHWNQPDSVTPGTPGMQNITEFQANTSDLLWELKQKVFTCYFLYLLISLPANFSAKQPSTAVVFRCLAGWQESWQAAAPLKFNISVNFCNASCKGNIRNLFNVTSRYSFPLIQYYKNKIVFAHCWRQHHIADSTGWLSSKIR